jgi:hypothetical protein
VAEPGAHDPEGRVGVKTENDLAISTSTPSVGICGRMRQRGSTSVENGQSPSADLLIALVRLLARQAAAEFASAAPVPVETSKRNAESRK